MDHFTPGDLNFPVYLPPDAIIPTVGEPVQGVQGDPSTTCGSVIECETQVLGENVKVAGTPFALHYRSDRVPGYAAARTARIPVTVEKEGTGSTTMPDSVERVDVVIDVAGTRSEFSLPEDADDPGSYTPLNGADRFFDFTWDGLDAYGRPVSGSMPGRIRVDWVYGAYYGEVNSSGERSFARPAADLGDVQSRQDLSVSRFLETSFGPLDARGWGVGGWTLSPHHFYDVSARRLLLGDGRRRSAGSIARLIDRVSGGSRTWPPQGMGGAASEALFSFRAGHGRGKSGISVAPDGSVLFTGFDHDPDDGAVFRIDPGGTIDYAATFDNSRPVFGVVSAPDGGFFVSTDEKIIRFEPDGGSGTVAGKGNNNQNGVYAARCQGQGDGTAATQANVCPRESHLVLHGGYLYFIDNLKWLRRVHPDGTLETVLGVPYDYNYKTPVAGTKASSWKSEVRAFTVDREGRVFFATRRTTIPTNIHDWAIYMISPENPEVVRVAGNGPPAGGGIGDGGPALEAHIRIVDSMVAGPNGGIYLAEASNEWDPMRTRIRHFTPGGEIRTVAGDGAPGNGGDGRAATQAQVSEVHSMAIGPSGSIHLTETYFVDSTSRQDRVRVIKPVFPPRSREDITVASDDGSAVFVFDRDSGRHVRTANALTGADLRAFDYDGDGRLVEVRELAPSGDPADDLVTQVERDAAGHPTAIVGPFGARTELYVDANGFLERISNPEGESHVMESSPDGLLVGFSPPSFSPGSYAYTFAYDDLGRLVSDTDYLGGSKTLTRREAGSATEIDIETALGRIETKRLEQHAEGGEYRTFTDASGHVTLMHELHGDYTSVQEPTGMATATILGPDPRLGLAAPVATERSNTAPSSLARVESRSRNAVLDIAGELVSQVDSISVNGDDPALVTLDIPTLTRTSDSPEGRRLIEELDAQGRVLSREVVGLEPVHFDYDDRGRLISTSQGQGALERVTTYTYGADGNLATIADPLSRSVSFGYDDAGRPETVILPGSRTVAYAYDDNGNLSEIAPPGRTAHLFRYTHLDQEEEYEPPTLGPDPRTIYSYDLDRELSQVDRPDGDVVTLGYDTVGRLLAVTTSRGTVTREYDPATGLVDFLSAPGAEALHLAYDGSLPTTTTWTGSVLGSVSHGYDSHLRVDSQSVNAGHTTAFAFDQDGLLTGAGDLLIGRDAGTGLLATTDLLGAVTTSHGHDAFGELVSESAFFGAVRLYDATFTRDLLGRVTRKVEEVEGATMTYDYRYDPAGRLWQVDVNGSLVRTYSYDGNGNRLTLVDAGAGTTSATYDAQDRLSTHGSSSYAWDAAGDLTGRTDSPTGDSTGYVYDALGNLSSVSLPDGRAVSYVIDAHNRRVGKRIDGALVQGWLYQDALNPVAELDAQSQVVSRFVYGTKGHVPNYMVKGGATYRILSDHLGSVRLVVDTATGSVAQRIDYDEFGNATVVTGPADFQPFAFAGGLYDADTKLTRFGARDYDAETGRWTTKDPIRFDGG